MGFAKNHDGININTGFFHSVTPQLPGTILVVDLFVSDCIGDGHKENFDNRAAFSLDLFPPSDVRYCSRAGRNRRHS